MRIAQLYHDFSQRGGAERHVETLSADLTERGHEVTIVSRTPPEGFRGMRLAFDRCKLPFSVMQLAAFLQRERIQLIHAHSRVAAMLAGLAIYIYRIPLVVTSHILPQGFSRFSQWGDATICVSEAVRRRLVEAYGLDPRCACMIHNGIDAGAASPSGGLAPFGPAPLISMAARFVPGKAHDVFLSAAMRLLESGFPGTFALAGDGPLLKKMSARYPHARIVFMGHRTDVRHIFAASTASVVCSESEAFPYVVLESLAAGTPVLSTDCGGPAEAIRPGFNGHLFPVGDTDALVRLAEGLAGETSYASRDRIAADCHARFSRERMLESTLAIYRKFYPEVC